MSFALLTLFTSPERAGSVQGDLMEEAQSRGRVWFWSQVIRTTGALCWQGFAGSPLAILKVMLCGGVAWFVVTLVMFAGDAAVEFLFRSLGVPIHIRAVWDFLLAALLTGIILGRAAPVRGMHASAGLAFASIPVLALLFNFRAIPPAGLADYRLTALALSEALLLLGTAFSRLRAARSG
jgi:hypothetical protein